MIDPQQIRMARAALNLRVLDLAEIAECASATLVRFEKDRGGLQSGTMARIKIALEARGVTFLEDAGEGSGVRVKAITKTT
jgi:transcriptional regulator with XRE-family HTH domain